MSEENKNTDPIGAALADIYADATEEIDKAGNAPKHRECARIFFRDVRDEFREYFKEDITVEDVEYLDGYFIFSHGTDSVVHFHIKECPGWKFGIWWGDPCEDGDVVPGEFFVQYEECIDKFKPAASEISREIRVWFDSGDPCSNAYEQALLIRFIKNEPYLAFCRDYYMWDYNEEYHTREEAKEMFDKYIERSGRHREYQAICEQKILEYVRNEVIPDITDAQLVDWGEDWTPRYEIRAPFSKNKNIFPDCELEEPGMYSLDDEEFDRIEEECDELCRQNDTWWDCPIDSLVYLYNDSKEESS